MFSGYLPIFGYLSFSCAFQYLSVFLLSSHMQTIKLAVYVEWTMLIQEFTYNITLLIRNIYGYQFMSLLILCSLSVEWQSSGSPPSAFQLPYDYFRKQSDSAATNGSHDINSSVDVVEDKKSKELDYDFNCFFLSSQRLELYKSIDFRCEDMLLGKSFMHL